MRGKSINFLVIGLSIFAILVVLLVNLGDRKVSLQNENNPLIESSNQEAETNKGNSVIGNSDQRTEDNNIVVSSAPTGPVQIKLEVLNLNLKFPIYRVPYANVNAGDKIVMGLKFSSSDNIEDAKIQPWLYQIGIEPITQGITEGLPFEVSNVKALQDYEYEFTLIIPESPKDTKYTFAVFMSGCFSGNCGSPPEMDFIVGNYVPPVNNGYTSVATTE